MVERARNLAAGGIAVRVQHAAAAVRAFAGEQQAAALTIELGAPVDQLVNRRRPFLHQCAHGPRVAQAVAGDQRVLLVQFDLVVVAQRGGDSALRVFR